MHNKYLKEYTWQNVGTMLANNKKSPKECNEDFNGRLAVITGATAGIGYYTAREFAAHGAHLLCINRNMEKSMKLCKEIREDFGVKCEFKIADFAHLSEVRRIGREISESDMIVDVFIHNAGIYVTKKTFTDDDIEAVFQVDYLGSFILNYLMKDTLKKQAKARIIFVNSEGHRFAIAGLKVDDLRWERRRYTGLRGYGSAKTAQLLSMMKFNDFFAGSGVTINAMHPGDVKTDMGENNGPVYRFFKHNVINRTARSPELSAKALYYLGASQEMEGVSGKFFNFTTEEVPAPHALDREVAEELWIKSIALGELQ